MEAVKRTFYLHPRNRNFVPGQPELPLNVTLRTSLELSLIFVCATSFWLITTTAFVFTEERTAQFRTEGIETTVTMDYCSSVRISKQRGSSGYTAEMSLAYMTGDTLMTVSTTRDGRCEDYPKQFSGVYLKNKPSDLELMSIAQLNQPFYLRQPGFLAAAGIWLVCLGTMIYCLVQYRINRRTRRQYHEDSLLLDGRVIAARSSYAGRRRVRYLTVKYEFESPQGMWLTGKQKALREGLRSPAKPGRRSAWLTGNDTLNHHKFFESLPPPGTPVKVLFVDARTFVLL